jgi:hypothetical protein
LDGLYPKVTDVLSRTSSSIIVAQIRFELGFQKML